MDNQNDSNAVDKPSQSDNKSNVTGSTIILVLYIDWKKQFFAF